MNTKQLFLQKSIILGIFFLVIANVSMLFAQVKIGDNPTTINGGSLLELESINKGLLMPRIALTNTTSWGLAGTPVAGMHVYNTATGITSTNTNYPTLAAKIGEYYWDGIGWVATGSVAQGQAGNKIVITSFEQSAGVRTTLFTNTLGVCPDFSTPSCGAAVDLNENGTFTITNTTNDVFLDVSNTYSAANATGLVQFRFAVYVDKTTPGVFENVSDSFITLPTNGCNSGSGMFRTLLKNLPVRTYSVKVYVIPWVNYGGDIGLGVGLKAQATCGNTVTSNNALVVTVSEP